MAGSAGVLRGGGRGRCTAPLGLRGQTTSCPAGCSLAPTDSGTRPPAPASPAEEDKAQRPGRGCAERGVQHTGALSPAPRSSRHRPPVLLSSSRIGGEKVILLSASAWGFITAATPLLAHLSSAHLVFMTFSRILTGLLQGRAASLGSLHPRSQPL